MWLGDKQTSNDRHQSSKPSREDDYDTMMSFTTVAAVAAPAAASAATERWQW